MKATTYLSFLSLGLAPTLRALKFACCALIGAGALVSASFAADGTWTSTTGGNWTDSANWSGGAIADGSGFTAYFTNDIAGDAVVSLNGDRTIGSLIFSNATASAWTVADNTNTLTLAGGTPTITTTTKATISSLIAGTSGLTKAGAESLTLTARSGFTGGTAVNDGTLVINAPNSGDSAIGTGTLTIGPSGRVDTYVNGFGGFYQNPIVINGGTLHQMQYDSHLNTVTMTGGTLSGEPGTLFYVRNNSIVVNASATTATISVPVLNVWAGVVFNVADGSATTDLLVSSGVVQGGGGLTKTGAGTMALTGYCDYAGATTVNGGTLQVSGSLINSAATVSQGTLELGSGGSVKSVSVQSAGTLATDPAGVNFYTVSGILTLAGNVRLNLNSDTATADNLGSLTGVTYGGTLTVTNLGTTPLANGQSFTLFTLASGTYGGAFANVILPALPGGLSWDVSQLTVNGTIQVVNTAPTPVFVPPAGGYVGAVSVSIQCGVPNATIHYTTDGTTPNGGSPSGLAPVTVLVGANTNLTIQAYATAPGYAASPVATATYQTVPTPVWLNPSGGSWAAAGNWSNNVPANGSGVNADFSALTLPADAPVTLDGNWTVGSLTFGDVGGQYGWSIGTGSSGVLTLDNGMNAPIIAVPTNQAATISAEIAGTSGMTKTGPGTLTLTARSSFGGDTTVNDGKLVINAPNSGNSAIGTGTLTIGPSGRVDTYVNGFGGFYQNPIVINGGTLHQVAADSHLNTVTMTGGTLSGESGTLFYIRNNSIVVNASAATSTISVPVLNVWAGTVFTVADGAAATDLLVSSGVVQGGGYLTKSGAGTMVLTGAGDYSGATTVNQGTLLVNGSLVNTAVIVTNATLGGTGTINTTVSLQNGATLAPGGSAVGTLTTGTETWNPGGTVVCKVASANNSADRDFLAINGTLNLDALTGTMTIKLVSMVNSNTPGQVADFNAASSYVWTVGSATGLSSAGNFANVVLDTTGFSNPHSGTFSLVLNQGAGTIEVHYTAALVPPVLASGVSLGGGQFQLTFSGPSGQTYKVLTSTNVALPVASWTQVTNGTFGASPVVFVDSGATNAQRFYRVVSP